MQGLRNHSIPEHTVVCEDLNDERNTAVAFLGNF